MKGRLICSLPFFDAIYQSAGKVFRFRGEVAAATSVGEGLAPPAFEFALFESAGKVANAGSKEASAAKPLWDLLPPGEEEPKPR